MCALALVSALSTLSACKQEAPRVVLDCPPFEPLPADRLTLDGARQAFGWAELRRELRYREALEPGYFLRVTRGLVEQSKIDRGELCYEQLYTVGRLLFEHEYGFADGLGRNDAKTREDPFRKVHEGELGGPETNSCTSCHWRGGPGGSGAVQDNSQLFGDGINTTSADERNPPALPGVGVAQALAAEMSSELQSQMAIGMLEAKDKGKSIEVPLHAKGVSFGTLRISARGMVDSSGLEGIDEDLVIKPFGWRGNFATIRDFVMVSTSVHLGLQSEDLVRAHAAGRGPSNIGAGPPDDPDGDGMTRELSAGQVTALVTYLASLESPIVAAPAVLRGAEARAPGLDAPLPHNFYDRFAEGQRLFDDIGCTQCHRPMMVLKNPVFKTRSEVSGKSYQIDLSNTGENPRLHYDEALGGYPVWLFSDLKRHDLGEDVAGKHPEAGIPPSEYLTRRLWGLAESPPYFYDGRAPSFDGAIAAHGGEAAFARDSYQDLDGVEKGSLRLYLFSLQRSPRAVVP